MPNAKGYLTKEEVILTNKPVMVLEDDYESKWRGGEPPKNVLLVTEDRASQIGSPIAANDRPLAYVYSSKANHPHRYVPFYGLRPHQVDMRKLNEHERRIVEGILTGPPA